MRFHPLRPLLTLLSPGGAHARLSILIYHRVLSRPDPLFPAEVDATAFDRQMRLLASFFNVIPLNDAAKALRSGSLPARAACVTFDDGYSDNAEVALPILQKHRIPATFFIATGFLNGGRMWNDTVIELVRGFPDDSLDLSHLGLGVHKTASYVQRAATIADLLKSLKYLPPVARLELVDAIREKLGAVLPNDLMMTANQVKTLHDAGMEIGAHTVSHPILASLCKAAALKEIADGKEFLEGLIRAPVKSFAYPNGKPHRDYLADHVHLVKELQFEAAVSTSWGAAQTKSDPFQLPRFTPWDKGDMRFMLRLARNMHTSVESASLLATPDSTQIQADELLSRSR